MPIVNRIFGDDHPLGDLKSDTHLINASYTFNDALKITAYGYAMDFDEAQSSSNKTYGARLTGKYALSNDWTASYEAEYAHQTDHANNTADYSENYYHIAPQISGHGFTLKAGYEVLEGDGTNAFQTPLATLHKFNGWADKFLSTPANGLEDAYILASYKASGTDTFLDGTKLTAVYHDFDGHEAGDYGSEFDLAIGKSFDLPQAAGPLLKKLNVTLKYADYNADDTPYTDTEKFWLQIGLKF